MQLSAATRLLIVTTLAAILVVRNRDVSGQQPQLARLIKVPLIRGITPGVGSLGQPVISYYAPVHIGSPAKLYNIQFDVGYLDLFVPHYTWNPFKVNLHYGKGFLCKESSSCVKTDRTLTSECQNNVITGKPYEDVMSFTSAYRTSANDSAGQPISLRQTFLAASDASDAKFRYLPVDGFFGLGALAQTPASLSNPLVSLHQSRLIDNLQLGLWFNPVLDSNQGGELVLGGSDTARYQGQVFWHRLASMNGYWTLNLQLVTLGGQAIGNCTPAGRPACSATISSALNEVYGPREQVKRIYELLNTVKAPDSELQLIDCRRIGQLPMLTLAIDGIPYSLLPSNYIRKTTDGSTFKSETCYVAVLPLSAGGPGDSAGQWILGTNFLGAYYSIYDITYRQVGFASLR